MADQNFASQADPAQSEINSAALKKTGAELESVQGTDVQIQQSTVNQVIAETASLRESEVRQVNGQIVNISQSSVGVAHGTSINISAGSVGICSATEAVVDGNAGVMIGQSVSLKNHRTGLVVTREVNGDSIRAVILLAGHSNAPVETLVDQRSVALFGIATGVAMGLVFSLFRLLKR